MAVEGFADVDFDAFHRDALPRLLASGRGALAAKALSGLRSLAFRLPNDSSWTYRLSGEDIALTEGDAVADVVIAIDRESWEGLVHDYESAPGLLYSGRVRCLRGDAMQLVLWEPALRAIYQGRPIYDPRVPLCDRRGFPLETTRVFRPEGDPADMAHFLRMAGYLVVRGLYGDEEVSGFLAEARELRREAVKGDKLSWWAKDREGREVVSRVTRGADKPRLATLYGDPRTKRLVELVEPNFVPRFGEGNGVTVIFKNAGATEGLSDLPWHRDCGMGGHSLMCPLLICSLFLTPANPDNGDLVFLPGSWTTSCGYMDPGVMPARAVRVAVEPGDVTLHYGDVMHAAPPPARAGLDEYRVSVVTDYGRRDVRNHRGTQSYNDALHQRTDGQIEHLASVVKRA